MELVLQHVGAAARLCGVAYVYTALLFCAPRRPGWPVGLFVAFLPRLLLVAPAVTACGWPLPILLGVASLLAPLLFLHDTVRRVLGLHLLVASTCFACMGAVQMLETLFKTYIYDYFAPQQPRQLPLLVLNLALVGLCMLMVARQTIRRPAAYPMHPAALCGGGVVYVAAIAITALLPHMAYLVRAFAAAVLLPVIVRCYTGGSLPQRQYLAALHEGWGQTRALVGQLADEAQALDGENVTGALLCNEVRAMQGEALCAHPALNALLSSKVEQARASGAFLTCAVVLPAALPGMNDVDLVTIMGNLLDNSLEAAPGGWVCLEAGIEADMLCLRVMNPGTGHHLRLHTTKREPDHGLGLGNVRDTVQRYGGSFRLAQSDGVVTAEAWLPLREGDNR